MDNRTSNNDDNKWVEESIAKLSPPSGWRPDADEAFERMMQQRRTPASISPVLRLSLAGATVVAIALIVTLLPWQTLWTPKTNEKAVSAQNLAEHLEPTAQPREVQTIPEPQQAPPTTTRPPSEESPKGPAGPAPPAPERPEQRPKKNPRPFASLQEEKSGPESAVAALQGAQGQNPQPPDTGVTPPMLISRATPRYTPEARQARVTGIVELVVTVLTDGTARFERITKSLGYGLDESSAAAAEQFRFIPGKKDGQPVAVSTTLQFNFSLK